MSTAAFSETIAAKRHIPRGRNELHTVFERNVAEFCEQYDEKYAATYSMHRLERIQKIGERLTNEDLLKLPHRQASLYHAQSTSISASTTAIASSTSPRRRARRSTSHDRQYR